MAVVAAAAGDEPRRLQAAVVSSLHQHVLKMIQNMQTRPKRPGNELGLPTPCYLACQRRREAL
jgi:hypothetical protein